LVATARSKSAKRRAAKKAAWLLASPWLWDSSHAFMSGLSMSQARDEKYVEGDGEVRSEIMSF